MYIKIKKLFSNIYHKYFVKNSKIYLINYYHKFKFNVVKSSRFSNDFAKLSYP